MTPSLNHLSSMPWLPFENITYRTKLSPEEVLYRLEQVMQPSKPFHIIGLFRRSEAHQYEGSFNENSFNIIRLIAYRNSFLPRIKGVIKKDISGTLIEVNMRLHPFVLAFLCIWMGGVTLACLSILPTLFSGKDVGSTMFIPFAMLLFAYLLSTGAFKVESGKSKKDLAKLFDASIEA
jgi:hypothetical protein